MGSTVTSSIVLTQRYTTAIDALCEIAKAYGNLGKVSDSQHVLRTTLELTNASEVQPALHLKLLLQYTRMLIVGQLTIGTKAELVFSTLEQARQVSEKIQDQQGIADVLSLLGQAHYFSTILTSAVLDSPQGQYNEALTYQQQALEIRERLDDTRGISESYFCIGNVYERWQQVDLALEHYTKARQIADEYGHRYERTEPSRHLSLLALQKGNLDQALTYATEALSFREEAGFKPYLPLDHVLLSTIYLAMGDTENALLHAQKASALAEKMGNRGGCVLSLSSLGDIYLAQKEEAKARDSYERALTLAEESQSTMLIARTKAGLDFMARMHTSGCHS